MKITSFLPLLLAAFGLSAAQDSVTKEVKKETAVKEETQVQRKVKTVPGRKTVELKDGSGSVKAVATLTQRRNGVHIQLRAHGLEPGEHALHFHQTAKCEGPAFTSAGPHFNPESKQHGMQNPQGAHAGDMPNFTAKKNGNANFKYVNKNVSLGDAPMSNAGSAAGAGTAAGSAPAHQQHGVHSLFTNGGTAIIIHAKADDHKTDPSGNAGDRVACGVITQ